MCDDTLTCLEQVIREISNLTVSIQSLNNSTEKINKVFNLITSQASSIRLIADLFVAGFVLLILTLVVISLLVCVKFKLWHVFEELSVVAYVREHLHEDPDVAQDAEELIPRAV